MITARPLADFSHYLRDDTSTQTIGCCILKWRYTLRFIKFAVLKYHDNLVFSIRQNPAVWLQPAPFNYKSIHPNSF